MPDVIFPIPQKEVLLHFALQTNLIADYDMDMSDVLQCFSKTVMDPRASGQFAACFHILRKLAKDHHWPLRHKGQADELTADKNLYWLRDLHTMVLKPIAVYGVLNNKVTHIPDKREAGQYRLTPKALGVGRPMPKPTAIKRLLAHWYKELGDYHLKIAPKVGRVGGFTLDEIETVEKQAEKFHVQLMCIHPFLDANGRVARLVENALRLRWGLKWKTRPKADKLQYVQGIMKFEDSTEWKTHLKTHNAL